jgi:SAM-dependent methyltransferase
MQSAMQSAQSARTVSSEEIAFLEHLNRNLPPGVDWKQGALNYVAAWMQEEHADLKHRFHLIKPFGSVYGDRPINQMLVEFIREMSHFLNVLGCLSVSPQTRFLDVACGSGWLTHFLAKLNLPVVGIDLCDDMIGLAQERLNLDRVPTVETDVFEQVNLFVHDIEQAPIPAVARCDVAILESALHHFINPIQALRNIADSLSDSGIVVILEAAVEELPPHCIKVMEQYQTLERPYSRQQLMQIVEFAGFAEYEFLYPVNGFFPQTEAVASALYEQVLHSQIWNTVVIAKEPGTLVKMGFAPSRSMSPTVPPEPSSLPDVELPQQ